MKISTIPWISAVMATALFGCEPVSDEGGMLAPFGGGVVQQAQLDGPPIAGSEAAADAERKAAEQVAAEHAAAEPESAASAEKTDASADPGGDGAAGERSTAAQALMAEEEAEIERAAAAAAASGTVVETIQPPVDGVAGAEPTPDGELAVPGADTTPPDAATAGELAADSMPVPPPSPEPTDVGGAAPVVGLEVLPPSPASDAEALAAIDRAAARPAPPAPDYAMLAATKSEPCAPEGFDAVPLRDLRLVQTWVEGTASRALLEAPSGGTRTVTQGSVVGPSGARVSVIGAGEVVFAEIQFDMDDRPILVQQRLRVASPR